MSFRNQQLFWDLRFYREPQDWETEQFDIFWNLIHSMTFIGEGQEKLCWKSTKNKGFKVSEFYLSLFSTSDNLFLWKSMWCSNIPLRVAFFSWTAALGKILTLDRLWNKGVPVMDWCYMCKRSGELVNHLLLHCPIAFELWSMVWSLFGGIWVMPQSVANLFASWQGLFGRQCNIDLWRAVPHCVLWCLWQERNSRCFERKEQLIHELKSLLLHSLFAWCYVFNSFSCSNFLVMLDHCNFRS